jgi:hypothetical protein
MKPLDRLDAALAAVEEAVACCMAVADLPPDTVSEVRYAAADTAVTDYEAAEDVAEALLAHILTAGGCPGLLDVLSAACDRASARALQPLGPRGRSVAQHARERAQSREQQVIAAVALPYWRRRVEAANATP